MRRAFLGIPGKMKKRARAMGKTALHRPYFSLLAIAVLVAVFFWVGEYIYASHLKEGPGSIQQWMWFTGFLFTSLFLAGFGCIFLLLRWESKDHQKNWDAKMSQMPPAHNPDFLAMNAGDLILLFDPPKEAREKIQGAAKPMEGVIDSVLKDHPEQPLAGSPGNAGSNPSMEKGLDLEEVEAGTSGEGVRFLYGNSQITEIQGRKAYQSMIQDVETAEREINQVERNQSKRRYRIVSEFAADWNYWQDLDKGMLYVSPACEDISGYPPRDFYKSSDLLDSIIHPEDRSLWLSHNQEELSEKSPGHLEFRLLAREGKVRWVSHFCKPVQDPHGRFLGVCGSNRDITMQKRAEEAVKIKTQELLRSNAELEQFAYVASHDLQTPLRAISGYLNLLTKRFDGKLDGDADRFIHRTHANVLRMQRLINDLLTYSRLTTRAHPFQPTDCDQVVAEVLEMLQPVIEESGARVTHGALPTIPADGGQLFQLFQNLIGNAIKFRDHRPHEVHVGAERADKGWIFSVKDNGIGIDPQYGERIFLIFQRLHTMDQYPGTGIGLAICKKIVERHGGKIWVESKAGEGATFKFLLPDPGGNPV
jgi:PAS domain S-box-containing protein